MIPLIRLNQSKKSKGQALLEFALALPVLLLLLFGIIEFGRLVQAWMAVQNSARFGLRYAITGEFNPDYCADAASALGLQAADAHGSSPAGYDCIVPEEYCELNGCDARELTEALQDWARLPSIRDAARVGIAGVNVSDADFVSGSYLDFLNNNNLTDLGDPDYPGYFHVTVCSNRDGDDVDTLSDFLRDESTNPKTCLDVAADPDVYMDDAGGPGNRVRVTVRFVHRMILPLINNIWPQVPLESWREGVVEKYRTSRIGGLGSEIGIAPTLTHTPLPPTETPIPPTSTYTPIPPTSTETPIPPTPTDTSTPTFTPTPSCSDLVVNGPLYFSDDDIKISLSNIGPHIITITRARTSWDEYEGQPDGPWHDQVDYQPLPTDQYFDGYWWSGSLALDVNPNIYLNEPGITFEHDLNLAMDPASAMNPVSIESLDMDFNRSFTSYFVYYHARDFQVQLSYMVGSLACPAKDVTGKYGPEVTAEASEPNPIENPFYVQAFASDPDGSIGRVRFEVWDQTETNILGYQNEFVAPYCLFGDTGGVCNVRDLGGYWPNMNNVIQNGTYVIYIQAYDNDTPANQYTRIKMSIVLDLTPLVPCNNTGTGLLGEYYTWGGSPPPVFSTLINLVYAVVNPQIFFTWPASPAPNVPADQFAVGWSGEVQPKYDRPEEYTFYFRVDDGVQLWVNGVRLISSWRNQSATEYSGKILLPAGCPRLPIEIQYYENLGSAVAELRWSSLSIPKEVIPRRNLYPPIGTLPPTITPTNTPLATNTPTITATRTPKPTFTSTAIPTRTSILPTATATATATRTVAVPPTNTPAPPTATTPPQVTATPTRTVSPTPCLTPPDLGGCR